LEDSNQEDQDLKPAQANGLRDLVSEKNPTEKIGLVEWLKGYSAFLASFRP
jgi:hypothetical protein